MVDEEVKRKIFEREMKEGVKKKEDIGEMVEKMMKKYEIGRIDMERKEGDVVKG